MSSVEKLVSTCYHLKEGDAILITPEFKELALGAVCQLTELHLMLEVINDTIERMQQEHHALQSECERLRSIARVQNAQIEGISADRDKYRGAFEEECGRRIMEGENNRVLSRQLLEIKARYNTLHEAVTRVTEKITIPKMGGQFGANQLANDWQVMVESLR